MKIKTGDLVVSRPVFNLGTRSEGPSVTYLFFGSALVVKRDNRMSGYTTLLHEGNLLHVKNTSIEIADAENIEKTKREYNI